MLTLEGKKIVVLSAALLELYEFLNGSFSLSASEPVSIERVRLLKMAEKALDY